MPLNYWTWIPRKSVGPFQFGDRADEVINRFRLHKLDRDSPIAYWDTYAIPGFESVITVEDNRLASILCCDAFYCQGEDLLGLKLNDARELLGPEEDTQEITDNYVAVQYSTRLGLTLWLTDGVITSVTCWDSSSNDV